MNEKWKILNYSSEIIEFKKLKSISTGKILEFL